MAYAVGQCTVSGRSRSRLLWYTLESSRELTHSQEQTLQCAASGSQVAEFAFLGKLLAGLDKLRACPKPLAWVAGSRDSSGYPAARRRHRAAA